jgi:hypothetical protein
MTKVVKEFKRYSISFKKHIVEELEAGGPFPFYRRSMILGEPRQSRSG